MCSGVVAALIANALREKGSRPLTPMDFVPGYQPEPQTDEEALAIFEAFAATHNASLKEPN